MRNGSRQRAARARHVTGRTIMWEYATTIIKQNEDTAEVEMRPVRRVLVGGGQPKRVLRERKSCDV